MSLLKKAVFFFKDTWEVLRQLTAPVKEVRLALVIIIAEVANSILQEFFLLTINITGNIVGKHLFHENIFYLISNLCFFIIALGIIIRVILMGIRSIFKRKKK